MFSVGFDHQTPEIAFDEPVLGKLSTFLQNQHKEQLECKGAYEGW
jgi:hypothetical protein